MHMHMHMHARRLQGFRIGGQAETAEERGEWCGPWSTAMQLIARREARYLVITPSTCSSSRGARHVT